MNTTKLVFHKNNQTFYDQIDTHNFEEIRQMITLKLESTLWVIDTEERDIIDGDRVLTFHIVVCGGN